MKYYIIREDLATELGLVAYSRGTAERGYLVNNGDLAAPATSTGRKRAGD